MGLSNWHVIYTRSRAEKSVYNDLIALGYEAYLPLNRTLRQWSDRKKWVEVPLIPSYVFVKLKSPDSSFFQKIPGAMCFIRNGNSPARLRDGDIEDIKGFLNNYSNVELRNDRLSEGSQVRIHRGSLKGNSGEIISIKRNYARLHIDILDLDLIAEVSIAHLEAV